MPYQPAPAGAAAAATAGAPAGGAQQQQQQQQPEPPAVDVVVQEDGSLATSSSPQLHHPLSGEAVQLPLPLDSVASFSADRLLLQAAAHCAAVQLAAVQAVLQRSGRLATGGTHAELSLAAPASPAAGAAEAPLPSSPALLLWAGGSVQLSLSVQLRTGRLLLAAGPAVLESEQGSSAQAAVTAAQQQLDQLQRDVLLRPLPPGTSRGMLAARLAASALARLSLQLSVRRRMDAAAAAAAGFGLARATLPQRLLQQHMDNVSLLLAPLSSNTLTLGLPAHQPPRDLACWASKQHARRQQSGGGSSSSGPGSVAESGATRCFMLLDFGDSSPDAVNEGQPAADTADAAGTAPPQLRVLLATCACTSRGTATRVLHLAELPQHLLQTMRQAADGFLPASSRKRRASDAAEHQQAAAAAGGEMELGLAAAAAWCKRQAGWAALRAQLQLLPTQHMEELSLAQPQRPLIRLPNMPVLGQLDAWAAKQLQPAGGSNGAAPLAMPASNGSEQPGTPAGADAAAQLGPPKPSAIIQLEEGETEEETGQWSIQLSSLYFARLAQLLQRHGVELGCPADDVQHVAPTDSGLTLAYSLQQGARTASVG